MIQLPSLLLTIMYIINILVSNLMIQLTLSILVNRALGTCARDFASSGIFFV